MTNHQRDGSISNAHEGRKFEADALEYFRTEKGLILTPSFSIPLGISGTPKPHCFDMGSNEHALLVECKSHNWTVTGNMPSAKMTVWNEAMYYFSLAPNHYKKILFVLEAWNKRHGKTLAQYYVDIHGHLIPPGVSIFEYNPQTKVGRYVYSFGKPEFKRDAA